MERYDCYCFREFGKRKDPDGEWYKADEVDKELADLKAEIERLRRRLADLEGTDVPDHVHEYFEALEEIDEESNKWQGALAHFLFHKIRKIARQALGKEE